LGVVLKNWKIRWDVSTTVTPALGQCHEKRLSDACSLSGKASRMW
jgi:hypothetical protein